MRVSRIGALVEQSGPAGLLPKEVLVLRGDRDGVMRDHVERSAGIGAEGDVLDHRRPVAERIHLRPGQHDAHRSLAARSAANAASTASILRPQAGTESAAHEGRHHAHVLRLQPQRAAQISLDVLHALGLVVDRELAVRLVDRRRGIELHRVVVLDRHVIFALVSHRGRRERLLGRCRASSAGRTTRRPGRPEA